MDPICQLLWIRLWLFQTKSVNQSIALFAASAEKMEKKERKNSYVSKVNKTNRTQCTEYEYFHF